MFEDKKLEVAYELADPENRARTPEMQPSASPLACLHLAITSYLEGQLER
jgi:hypothetical protein